MICCGSCLFLAIITSGLVYLFNRWYRRDFIPDFSEKYVFITGTDSGFGHKLAVDLDSQRVHVYAGCFTKEGAQKLKNKATERLKTILLDVTDQNSVDQAKAFIENDLSPGKSDISELWGVVNNSGIMGNMSFELSTLDDYRHVMEVNCFGSVRVTEAFSPLIKKSKGRIVQIASMFGRGCICAAPYTSSKYAVEPYADELRRYMRKFGVHVSTIEPGFMKNTALVGTNVWADIIRRNFEALPDWKKAELGYDFADKEVKIIGKSVEEFPCAQWNSIGMVTEAMTHALGAKHPKSRYLVGYDARPYVLFTGFTPDWFLDGFVRLSMWLSSRKT